MSIVPVSLACERPADIAVPDGSMASEQEMRDANAAIHTYLAGMRSYLDCLEAENDRDRLRTRDANTTDVKRREDTAIRIHNAAATDMENVAVAFEQAVADFKSRQ